MNRLIARALYEESGQDLIEYALLAAFISLVAVTAISSVGEGVNRVWGQVDSQMQSVPTGAAS